MGKIADIAAKGLQLDTELAKPCMVIGRQISHGQPGSVEFYSKQRQRVADVVVKFSRDTGTLCLLSVDQTLRQIHPRLFCLSAHGDILSNHKQTGFPPKFDDL